MLDAVGSLLLRLARRPWIGVMVCVLVCALFAAQAVGHVIEAQVLGDAHTAPKIPKITQPEDTATHVAVIDRVGQGSELVKRDMFCSTCTPAPPQPGVLTSSDGTGVPMTELPLVLVATSLGHQPIATVRDDRSGSQGAYYVGEELPGTGEITRIGATYVDFVNAKSEREERVSMLGAPKGPDTSVTTTAAATPDNPYADRVKKIDDTRFEVERGLIKELVGAAGKPMPGVRMMPVSKDGKLAGIRVIAARPDSIAGALGMKGGDNLVAVNGVPIDSLDKMLEVYSKIDDMNVVTIDGTRQGKPISWEYKLR